MEWPEISLSSLNDRLKALELVLNGDSFRGDHLTLAILDIFATPKSLAIGLEELQSRQAPPNVISST